VRKLSGVLAVVGLVALTALGLASCGSSGSSGKEGGVLKAGYPGFPDYMDPQLSYTAEGWTAMWNSYVPLLTYAHAEGVAGSRVIPGLAESMPKISNGGKTYTLQLRNGLKYSDGTPVKASDFTYAVERLFKLNSGGLPFYTTIVGAEKFLETKKGGIPGIETNDTTGKIVINLEKPRGTFTDELGLMFVAPVPPDTPAKNLSADPPPATGPYVITKSDPGRGFTIERNPEWAKNNAKLIPDWPSGHIDKFEFTINQNTSTQVNEVEQGKSDWMQASPPADRYAEVKSKYEGTQFREDPEMSTYYFWMNTTKAPFDDLKVRQAVNYAVDTAALERIYTGQQASTHQILPPGMPGYKKFDLYPHNMAKAKKMIEEANPSDRDITVWTDNESPNDEAGAYYEDVLKKLGFNTNLKVINGDDYFTVIGNLSTPDLDTGWVDWLQDYPHPNDFFQPLLAGESILQTNNGNFAQLNVQRLDKKIAELGEEALGPKQEAEYAAMDREYMELAPWVPYGTRTLSTFVSSSVNLENVIYNPTFGQDLASFEFK
jgi:peptide/nickel transport system substrate-binding protein